MIVYKKRDKGPVTVDGYFDPNSIKQIQIAYIPPTWEASKVYLNEADNDYSIVIPPTFAGLYFKCISPGMTGSTQPTWPTVPGKTVTDGSVGWEAVAYNLATPTLTITTSTWTSSAAGAVFTGAAITSGVTSALLSTVPPVAAGFTITNHVVFSNGEEDDMTLLFKVAQR